MHVLNHVFADRYMKYLYPYEQQKENLSTQEQLQTAIETNRRESRRNNYNTYATNNENMVARNQHNPLPSNALALPMPLSMAQMDLHGSQSAFVNGHPQHHSHNSQHVPPNLGQVSNRKFLFLFFLSLSRSNSFLANVLGILKIANAISLT